MATSNPDVGTQLFRLVVGHVEFSEEDPIFLVDPACVKDKVLKKLLREKDMFDRKDRIRLHNVTGADGMAMLRADEADFAVGSMLEMPDDLSYYPVFNFNPTLITPLDHPLANREKITLEEIAEYDLILPPRYLSTWGQVKSVFQQNNIQHKVTIEAGGWAVIKKYVEMGLGISIVTDICLEKSDQLGTTSVKDFFPTRSYGIVMRRGKFIPAQAKRFIELMAPEFFHRAGDEAERPLKAVSSNKP